MIRNKEYIKWFGTVMFIGAAILLSANIEISRFGFFMFISGHIALSYLFFQLKDYALFSQNFIFIFVDAFGIYRWFIV